MREPPSPYIPLSWLREQRKFAREYLQLGDTLTEYDLWLWIVRQEIDRLLMLELRKENTRLTEIIENISYYPALLSQASELKRKIERARERQK